MKPIKNLSKGVYLKVEDSDNHRDYRHYEDLRMEIWDDREDHLASSRNLLCEVKTGSSVIIGAFKEENLIGFAYGWFGIKDRNNAEFYAQYNAVKEEYRGLKIGIELKKFQREVVLDRGVDKITCTYDPLTGQNAYRNIALFGMEVKEYEVDVYKGFKGKLNRKAVPSDRFFAIWHLTKENKKPDYNFDKLLETENIINPVIIKPYKCYRANMFCEFERIVSIGFELENRFLLVRIPENYYLILRENVHLALKWRLHTRDIFRNYFSQNYRVIDFQSKKRDNHKENYYILYRE